MVEKNGQSAIWQDEQAGAGRGGGGSGRGYPHVSTYLQGAGLNVAQLLDLAMHHAVFRSLVLQSDPPGYIQVAKRSLIAVGRHRPVT